MIPANRTLVTLCPARQAALQAIVEIEQRCAAGKHLSENPYARAFLRRLAGSSRINTRAAQQIPGLSWDPGYRMTSLKQVEEALNTLIYSHGEHCPLPLPVDVQAAIFPEITWQHTERAGRRSDLRLHKAYRQEAKKEAQDCLKRQNLLRRAGIALNFCSPENVQVWYSAWQRELEDHELQSLFWRWQRRFTSLKALDWMRYSGEPFWAIMNEIRFIVSETSGPLREAERWMVPNKLRHQRAAS